MSTIFPTQRAPFFLLLLLFLFTSSMALAEDEPGYLGVFLQDLEPSMLKALQLDDQTGVLISDIADDSPAEEAGLEDGDIILEFDGTEITSSRRMTRAVRKSNAGDDVKVVVLRDGKKKTIEVTLGERKRNARIWSGNEVRTFRNAGGKDNMRVMKWNQDDDGHIEIITDGDMADIHFDHDVVYVGKDRGFLGIHLDNLSSQLADYFGVEEGEGVLVTEVNDDGPAEKAGLKAGDVIVKVDGQSVGTSGEVHKALSGTEADQNVTIELKRKGATKEFEVTLGETPENQFFKKLEIFGEDGHYNIRSPKMKRHMAPHIQHKGDFDDEDHDVMFFRSDDDEEDLKELREELKEMKKELKKIKEELK
jgi:membrane-associated protease RseP (regulator of RpoE activity)